MLQLLGIVVVVPLAALFAYWLTTGGHPNFHEEEKRVVGYMMLTFMGVFFAPWIALGALLRQREAFARTQALAFDLERSELERKARRCPAAAAAGAGRAAFPVQHARQRAGARRRRARRRPPHVLKSLIAYLRAAVPRLNEPSTTLGQELELVRAYLEVMQMRMPDRLDLRAAGRSRGARTSSVRR